MSQPPVDIDKVAAFFPTKWNQHYTRSKLRTDPLYEAVHSVLMGRPEPLLDLGCGLGINAFYLRERGYRPPIFGIDYDSRKIEVAQAIAAEHYKELRFEQSDARQGLPDHQGNVAILDILQFFTPEEQTRLLSEAANRVAPGGVLVIRSGLRDRSLRFRITWLGDLLAKATRWMKAAPVHYPTRQSIESALNQSDLTGTFHPLWGKTPFNNYLIVFERPA